MKPYARTRFVRFLIALCNRQGMNNTYIANQMGMRPNVISMILTGRMALPPGRFDDLMKALRVSSKPIIVKIKIVAAEAYPDNRAWRAIKACLEPAPL